MQEPLLKTICLYRDVLLQHRDPPRSISHLGEDEMFGPVNYTAGCPGSSSHP